MMMKKERKVVQMDDYHNKRAASDEPFDPAKVAVDIGSTNPEARREWVRLKAIKDAAETLRTARSLAKLSQAELAKRTGIQQSAISRLENAALAANGASDGAGVGYIAQILDECGCELVISLKVKS